MKVKQLLLTLLFTGTLLSGFSQKTQWYKGNLHTHSLWSDGDDYPEMIMEWYKTSGYDFVALSDHNTLAEGEKWLDITGNGKAQKAFQAYLALYGEDWVNYREEADTLWVQLKTLEAYRHLFEEKESFLILQAEEITDAFEGKPIHMNATNLAELIKPQGGNSLVEVMQNNINAVQQQRWLTGRPMLIHLNHPNFGWAVTAEDLIALTGERFFEVFNGHPMVHNSGDATHNSTSKIWDIVNSSYLQTGKHPMYGLATDDSHHYHETDPARSNTGRGWIHVRAKDLSPKSLIEAMEAGNFYASSGVELAELKSNRKKLSLEIAPKPGVNYTIQFIGTVGKEVGKVLQEVKGTTATYRFTGQELYVRARIISDNPARNPIEEAPYEMAWTQPVGWTLPSVPTARK